MSAAATDATSVQKPKPKRKCNPLWGLLAFVACLGGTIGGVMGGIFGNRGDWIKGHWATNFGSYWTVTGDKIYAVSSWGTTVYRVQTMTNSYAIMQNPSTDAWNPDKWTKMEYHAIDNGKWAYCSTVYNADTHDAALETDTSSIYNTADAAAGCNGFAFTEMSAFAMPIAGSWTTNFNQELTIDASQWASKSGDDTTTYRVEAYGAAFVLMQNAPDAQYNADQWTKVQFHTVGSGFGYCMSVYNGATATAALTTDTTMIYAAANASDGCNGFSHTIASPA